MLKKYSNNAPPPGVTEVALLCPQNIPGHSRCGVLKSVRGILFGGLSRNIQDTLETFRRPAELEIVCSLNILRTSLLVSRLRSCNIPTKFLDSEDVEFFKM